jgi:hypothetical protein
LGFHDGKAVSGRSLNLLKMEGVHERCSAGLREAEFYR